MKSLFFLSIVACFTVLCRSDLQDSTKLVRILSDRPCKSLGDCEPNSYCHEQTYCKCDPNYLLEKNNTSMFYKCLKIAIDINSNCENDSQCKYTLGTPAYCNKNENTCDCEENAHYDKGTNRCYKTARYGEECLEDRQCLNPDGTYAYCIRGKCGCGDNQYYTELGNCVKKVRLGDVCEKDENCEHIQGICQNVCKCGFKHVVSSNNDTCLKAALEFGENCTELAQCNLYLHDAICLNQKCDCDNERHPIDQYCYKSVSLGSFCSHDKECFVNDLGRDDVICEEGVCVCKNDKCKTLENPNSSGNAHLNLRLILLVVFVIPALYL